jgi:MFS family permease
VLVLALWFSASAVVPALLPEWGLSRQGGIWLTAAVQVGFAAGAVVSAALNLADRIRPQVLIGAAALLGALATVAVVLWARSAAVAIPLRFLTGFALAGVYRPTESPMNRGWMIGASGSPATVITRADCGEQEADRGLRRQRRAARRARLRRTARDRGAEGRFKVATLDMKVELRAIGSVLSGLAGVGLDPVV